jgi:hypothetical protein
MENKRRGCVLQRKRKSGEFSGEREACAPLCVPGMMFLIQTYNIIYVFEPIFCIRS